MSSVGISCSSATQRSVVPPPVPPRPNKALVAEALAKTRQDIHVPNIRPTPGNKPKYATLERKSHPNKSSSSANEKLLERQVSCEEKSLHRFGLSDTVLKEKSQKNEENRLINGTGYDSMEEKHLYETVDRKPASKVTFTDDVPIYEDLEPSGKNSPNRHYHPGSEVKSQDHGNKHQDYNFVKFEKPQAVNRYVLSNQNREEKQKFSRVPVVLPTGQHMHDNVVYPSQNSFENVADGVASNSHSVNAHAKEMFSSHNEVIFPLVENLIVELQESSQKRSRREKQAGEHSGVVSEPAATSHVDLSVSKENVSPGSNFPPDYQPNIRHSDWFEVVDSNGKAVRYSTCQITVDSPSPVQEPGCNNNTPFDFRPNHRKKPRVLQRMASLQGLPPLPKSLSGFNLFENSGSSSIYRPSPEQQKPQQPQKPAAPRPGAPRRHVHPKTSPPPPPPHHLRAPQNGMPASSSSLPKDAKSPIIETRKPTFLDAQLALLRKEMCGLRQLDMSLLSQLWSLNESIQEFRQLLQEQEEGAPLSPPSPSSAEEGEEFYSPARYHPPLPPVPDKLRLSSSSSQSSIEYGDM